jgi:preprotein translocase subunit Sec63
MTKKTNLTHKELIEFYDQYKYIEGAIWHCFNSLDENMAVLGLIKSELEKSENKPYRAIKGIDALFTLLINTQSELMESARLEY